MSLRGRGVGVTKTSEFLSGVVEESFKREVDLDESVWRTLPFFVAAFGLGLPLLGYISAATAAIQSTIVSISAHLLFGLSIAAFAWAFRWFWTVVAPLEYQYPPSDGDLLEYASELHIYHEKTGLVGDRLDETVAEELRTFVTEQLAAATGKNRGNNALRVQARSQAILFLMVGFGLAILSEAAIID